MTLIAAAIVLFLVIGIVGAIAKRLFRVALIFGVLAILVVGIVIFVIGGMH